MQFDRLYEKYKSGEVVGALVDSPDLPLDIRRIAKEQRNQYFAEVDSSPFYGDKVNYVDILSEKEGVALPFATVLDVDHDSLSDVQKTGDCYSHSTRGMIDLVRRNEKLNGYETKFIEESATCLIYALRNRRGEGMTLYEVMNACKAGIILEKEYHFGDGRTVDLRNYDEYWPLGARDWVNNVPREVLEEAALYPIGDLATVDSMEEIRAGLFAGRAFSCGSSINPGRTRNEYGIVSLQRSPIAHAMLICGVDTRKIYHRENLYIWDNSWPADFYRGNVPIYGEEFGVKLPKCCFVLSESDTWAAVKQKGTFTASLIKGFPILNLPNYGTTGRI